MLVTALRARYPIYLFAYLSALSLQFSRSQTTRYETAWALERDMRKHLTLQVFAIVTTLELTARRQFSLQHHQQIVVLTPQ